MLYGTPLAISEPGLNLVTGIIEAHLSGVRLSDDEKEARAQSRSYGSDPGPQNGGTRVAVLNLHGPIMSRGGDLTMSGYANPQRFAAQVRAAADDPDIARIVISIDSPGGSVSGTRTAAEAVAYARGKKEVLAVADDLAASAAYWIGSQATKFVADPGATVGSIGVLMALKDTSEQNAKEGVQVHVLRSGTEKALGQPGEAITDETLAHRRESLMVYHEQFVDAVAAGRGVPRARAAEWATGRTWIGQAAVDAGLADTVGTLREAVAGAFSSPVSAARPAAGGGRGASTSHPPGGTPVDPETLALLGLAEGATPEQVRAAIAKREADARAAAQANIYAALGVTSDTASDADLRALSARAKDGETYRQAQLDRLHALTITIEGNHEAGRQAADDAREVYAGQSLERIGAQIARLEAKRDTLPNGARSQHGDRKSAPKALPASAYGRVGGRR